MIRKVEIALAYALIILLPLHYILFSIIFDDISVLKFWKEIVIFTLLGLRMYSMYRNKESKKINITEFFIILFFVFEIIYILIANKIYPALYIARVYTEPLLIYFIFKNLKLSKDDYKNIFKILLIESTIISMYGIFQSVVLGDDFLIRLGYPTKREGVLRSSFYLNGLGDFQRNVGTFVSSNTLAFFLGIIGIASLYANEMFEKKKFYYIQILLVLSGIILTFSRSVWLGIAISIIFMFAYSKNKKLFLKIIAIIACVSLLLLAVIGIVTGVNIFGNIIHLITRTLSFEDTSTLGHISSLQKSADIFSKNIMGTGLGMNGPKAVQFYEKPYLTESSYFLLLFEFGIIGTIIYIGIFISMFIRAFLRKRQGLASEWSCNLIHSITAFVLVTFIFLPFVQDMEIISFYFILAGLCENSLSYDLNKDEQLIGSKIKKVLGKILYIAINYLSMLSIRSNRIYIFGAWFGNKFSDNSKYLYLQASKDKDIRCIWITKNQKVYQDLKDRGIEVYMHKSLRGIFYQLRAKYYFTCTADYDVNSILLGGARHINLWHGIPLKKIMWDDKISNVFHKKSLVKKVISKIYNLLLYFPKRHQYLISSSEEITKIYISAFRIKEDKIFELGQPRNDVYFDKTLEDEDFPGLYKEKNVILYMPTHRNKGETKLLAKDLFDLKLLDEFCEKNNTIFLIKKHFYHANEIEDISEYKNIIDITNENFDSQLLLKYADILITDYSSCYIDYLLLDRPIIFYSFDYMEYTVNDRELYFDYSSVTPGLKVDNFKGLFSSLNKLIIDKNDEFINERKVIKNLFYNKENQNIVSFNILKTIREK